MTDPAGEAAIALVRKNTMEVQSGRHFELFDEIFDDDFVDYTPQPGVPATKEGVRVLYSSMLKAFPDFHATIHWQAASGDLVTTYKTCHGTHRGEILGVEATGREVTFDTVDVMRVVDNKIVAHWGVANLLSLVKQIGGLADHSI